MVSTVQDKETGLPLLHVWNKCNSLSPTWSQRYGEARVPQVDFVGQSLAHKEIMIWRQFSIILPSVFHKFFNTKTSSIHSFCSYSIIDDWFNQYADLTKIYSWFLLCQTQPSLEFEFSSQQILYELYLNVSIGNNKICQLAK